MQENLKTKGTKGFLNFEFMITPIIMKWFYIIGSIITLLGLLAGLIGVSVVGFNIGGGMGFVTVFFGGLGVIIGTAISLVIFRVFCEWLVLFFSMHKELKELNGKK